jgi:histidine ammonia-lyase
VKIIGDAHLTFEDICDVAFDGEDIEIAPDARAEIDRAAEYVRRRAEAGEAVYGVTTGFGANRDRIIDAEDAGTLQERLIMSHAAGVGDPLPETVVRAMLLLRINALAQGNSGIRYDTLETLVTMLNRGVHPVVPQFGSVGSSGDLCPLAHMCLPLIGRGEVVVDGDRMPGEQGMLQAGLEPIELTYKEGLALLNGTQAQTATGLVAAKRFLRVLDCADAIGAMSLEAVAGRVAALDERIHQLRHHDGQVTSARRTRRMLEGSELAGAEPGEIEGKEDYIQDSYSIRCMPQVHGASRGALEHVIDMLVAEANAVTDNPLVFPPDELQERGEQRDQRDSPEPGEPSSLGGDILSGGNFHGQPMALALDYLKVSIAEIGNISERRCAKLVDKHFSEGLPPFLIEDSGVNSGMMIPQYVAAALVSENKSQAYPSSTDSIPTSANEEDHVSMGMHAGLHAFRAIRNVEMVLGIEYLVSAQALDLRGEYELGEGTGQLKTLLREHVSYMKEDRVLQPDVKRATELVRNGEVHDLIGEVIGRD